MYRDKLYAILTGMVSGCFVYKGIQWSESIARDIHQMKFDSFNKFESSSQNKVIFPIEDKMFRYLPVILSIFSSGICWNIFTHAYDQYSLSVAVKTAMGRCTTHLILLSIFNIYLHRFFDTSF